MIKSNFEIKYNVPDNLLKDKYYFDIEFNKLYQIASIGCVFISSGKIKSKFHIVVNDTRYLTKNLEKTINEGTKTVNKIKSLCKEFNNFLIENGDYPMLCWGGDGEVLNKRLNGKYKLFKNIIDVSGIVSNSIYYNKNKVSSLISLKTMKKVYNIKGGIKHEALQDAIDLSNIFESYINKKDVILNEDLLKTYIN